MGSKENWGKMPSATVVRITMEHTLDPTLEQRKAICGFFGGKTPELTRSKARYTSWLQWEQRINPDTGRSKKYLAIDLMPPVDDQNRHKLRWMCDVFVEDELWIYFRNPDTGEWDDEYEKYLYEEERLYIGGQ